MFFNQKQIAFQILEVVKIDQSNEIIYNKDRNYDALSYRIDSDAVIETDKQSFALGGGSVGFFPASLPYKRVSKKDELIVVHLRVYDLRADKIETFMPKDKNAYKELFEQIYQVWQDKKNGYEWECLGLLCKILALAYEENANENANSKIAKGVEYLNAHCLKSDFRLQEVAKQSFMSETYFRRLFKKEYGISPKTYLINKRISHAQALIISGHFTVREVAEKCGYDDCKHFSTEFKKITGVSPSKYKYNYKGE